ncbi:MAG: protein-glutamate methylesterase/protein-glutamine glutaminase [Bacillota bacterium]
MNKSKKIKVLVVDDSLVFREVLSRGISSDPDLEVVAVANDAFDARDKIIEYEPDVMTCDVEMPKMNGIEFIKRLMPQYPLPIIVVSSISNIVFDAMNAGAVDFIAKPDMHYAGGLKAFINELNAKIKTASTANLSHWKNNEIPPKNIGRANVGASRALIAIGASTGGTEAIYSILQRLPESVPGIVVVQHIPPVFSRMYAERLNSTTWFQAKEAETGDFIESGRVLVAPGDKHMRIKKAGDKYKVECFKGEKVSGHCPSVDVLFESVAKEAGREAIGIILTGMGYDGAKGLLSMRKNGARTIGQDEKSSVVYGMPKVAYSIGAVERQASLDDIPGIIFSMLG